MQKILTWVLCWSLVFPAGVFAGGREKGSSTSHGGGGFIIKDKSGEWVPVDVYYLQNDYEYPEQYETYSTNSEPEVVSELKLISDLFRYRATPFLSHLSQLPINYFMTPELLVRFEQEDTSSKAKQIASHYQILKPGSTHATHIVEIDENLWSELSARVKALTLLHEKLHALWPGQNGEKYISPIIKNLEVLLPVYEKQRAGKWVETTPEVAKASLVLQKTLEQHYIDFNPRARKHPIGIELMQSSPNGGGICFPLDVCQNNYVALDSVLIQGPSQKQIKRINRRERIQSRNQKRFEKNKKARKVPELLDESGALKDVNVLGSFVFFSTSYKRRKMQSCSGVTIQNEQGRRFNPYGRGGTHPVTGEDLSNDSVAQYICDEEGFFYKLDPEGAWEEGCLREAQWLYKRMIPFNDVSFVQFWGTGVAGTLGAVVPWIVFAAKGVAISVTSLALAGTLTGVYGALLGVGLGFLGYYRERMLLFTEAKRGEGPRLDRFVKKLKKDAKTYRPGKSFTTSQIHEAFVELIDSGEACGADAPQRVLKRLRLLTIRHMEK